MLSVKDVATTLKVSEQCVRGLLREHKIEAEMVGKQWVIQPSALDDYIKLNDIAIEPNDHARLSNETPDIVALSFFTGAMGLDIGMEQAGIKALLACECDKACRITINENRPDMALIGDINNYTAKEILDMAKIPKNRKVDVIFGGPPCQAFSTAGARRAFHDSRGNVFLKYLDIVSEIKPKYVVIENVRGLLSAPFPYSDDMSYEQCLNSDLEPIKGGALLHILRKLKKAGYTASFELYNAANFGAPQIRERVVIVGRHGKTKMPYLVPTHSKNGEYNLPKWKTLGEALSKLPRDVVHHYIEFPERRLKYYRMLKAGQYWKDLPLDMQKEAMGKSFNLGGGKTGFYRRLAFDKPSPTLVTHPAMPATDLGHPVDDRPLSVEEYACIQEFPKDWKIYGSLVDKYKQIGNAVPIALGNAIGHLVMASIEGEKIPSYLNFNYSRYKYTNDINWAKEMQKKLNKVNAPKQLALAV